MEMPAAPANSYDAMASQISMRKKAVSNAQSISAELHVEQYGMPNLAQTAQSKLEKYRASSSALNSYNRTTTELFLDPTGQAARQAPSRIQRPQRYHSGAPNGSFAPASNGGEMSHGSGDRDESRDETIARLNKALRIKNTKIEEQAAELVRYKGLLDGVDEPINDIIIGSRTTDQRVAELAYDLEQKTREVEQYASSLAEVEQASCVTHQENLKLAERMQDMTRLGDEQQEQLQRALAAAAAAEAAVAAAAAAVPAVGGVSVEIGEGEGLLQKELEKLKQVVEMKTHQLEAVKGREEKTRTELRVYKGQARSGRFKSLLLKLWGLLRAVGFLGFLLFVYLAVSQDAFRSRGVDVYRLAH